MSILASSHSAASSTSSNFLHSEHYLALKPSSASASEARLAASGGEAEGVVMPRRGECFTGLVYSQTSGTPTLPRPVNAEIEIDSKATRLKRMKCSIITAARLHVESQPNGFRKQRAAFITLTYRPGVTWEANHSSSIIRHMRQWFARRGEKMRFVWVMELHLDGRPHYHALVWLPKGLTLPKPDKQGWWPHGHTKIEYARNPVGYIAKYASKGEHSGFKFPDGARIHGSGGLTGEALLEQRWWKLPSWCREITSPSDRCKRMKGGGIVSQDSGEIFITPWAVFFKGGKVFIMKKEGLP